MNSPKLEIESALVDVRKAYRLLHDYQQAALDAAKYIGKQLGLKYEGGYSYFSNCAPRDGKGSLDNWAWDWLNLMFYDFCFSGEKVKDGSINLSIWLFSDTGFFISDNAAPDQRTVSTFAPAERSGTKVGFLVYRDWKGEYNNQLRDSPTNLRRFIESGELPTLLKDAGVLGKCYDFSQLADEASTREVIDELVLLSQGRGFSLKRVTKIA